MYSLAHLVALGLAPAKLIELAAHAGYDAVGLRLTEIVPGGHYWPVHAKRELMRDALRAKQTFGVAVLATWWLFPPRRASSPRQGAVR